MKVGINSINGLTFFFSFVSTIFHFMFNNDVIYYLLNREKNTKNLNHDTDITMHKYKPSVITAFSNYEVVKY